MEGPQSGLTRRSCKERSYGIAIVAKQSFANPQTVVAVTDRMGECKNR